MDIYSLAWNFCLNSFATLSTSTGTFNWTFQLKSMFSKKKFPGKTEHSKPLPLREEQVYRICIFAVHIERGIIWEVLFQFLNKKDKGNTVQLQSLRNIDCSFDPEILRPWLPTAFKRWSELYNDSFCKSDLKFLYRLILHSGLTPKLFSTLKWKNLGDHNPSPTRTYQIPQHISWAKCFCHFNISFFHNIAKYFESALSRTTHYFLCMKQKSHFSLFKMFLYKKVLKVTGQNSVDYRK